MNEQHIGNRQYDLYLGSKYAFFLSSVVHSWSPRFNPAWRGINFFFQIFDGELLLKCFFFLNNFTFTMVAILHFTCIQFSIFRTCTIFWNNELYIKNFLQHLIFYKTLLLKKISTRLQFLYYFSEHFVLHLIIHIILFTT